MMHNMLLSFGGFVRNLQKVAVPQMVLAIALTLTAAFASAQSLQVKTSFVVPSAGAANTHVYTPNSTATNEEVQEKTGKHIHLRLSASNGLATAVSNLVVSQAIPASMYPQISGGLLPPDVSYDAATRTFSWNISSLGAGITASRVITMNFKANVTCNGTDFTFTPMMTASGFAPVVQGTVKMIAVAERSWSLYKSCRLEEDPNFPLNTNHYVAHACNGKIVVPYSLTFGTTGDSVGVYGVYRDITITDQLPANATLKPVPNFTSPVYASLPYYSFTDNVRNYTFTNGLVSFNTPVEMPATATAPAYSSICALVPGRYTVGYNFTVEYDASFHSVGSSIDNTASAQNLILGTNCDNDMLTSNTTHIRIVQESIGAVIGKSAKGAGRGCNGTYTIGVANTGNTQVGEFIITDDIPAGFQMTDINVLWGSFPYHLNQGTVTYSFDNGITYAVGGGSNTSMTAPSTATSVRIKVQPGVGSYPSLLPPTPCDRSADFNIVIYGIIKQTAFDASSPNNNLRNCANMTYQYPGSATIYSADACAQMNISEAASRLVLDKHVCSPLGKTLYDVGDIARYHLAIDNRYNTIPVSAGAIMSDTLPKGIVVPAANMSAIQYYKNRPFTGNDLCGILAPVNTTFQTTALHGTLTADGRQILQWILPEIPNACVEGVIYEVFFDATVGVDAALQPCNRFSLFTPNTINWTNSRWNNSYFACIDTRPRTALNIKKESSTDGITWATTTTAAPGATVQYRVKLNNTGNTDVSGIRLYERMPKNGDQRLLDCAVVRGSQFAVPYTTANNPNGVSTTFTNNIITATAPPTISANNTLACNGNTLCTSTGWVSPAASNEMVRFDYDTLKLRAGATLIVRYSATMPAAASHNQIAVNSVGVCLNDGILPTESNNDTVRISNPKCIDASAIKVVQDCNQNVSLSAQFPQGSACAGGTILYAWLVRNTLTNALTTYTNPTPTFHITDAGPFEIRLITRCRTAQNTICATDTIFSTFTGYTRPVIAINKTISCTTVSFVPSITGGAGCTNRTYLWRFGDGTTSTAENPVHLYAQGGNYVIDLKVCCTRPDGVVCCDSVCCCPILVTPCCDIQFANNDPEVGIFYYESETQAGFTGFESVLTNETCNGTKTYLWTVINTAGVPIGTSTVEYPDFNLISGTYTVCVRVRCLDANGVICDADSTCGTVDICDNFTTTVTATPIDCGYYQMQAATSGCGGNTVYEWNFGDNSNPVIGGATVSHHYINAGSYTVCVTAVCDMLCSASACTNIIYTVPTVTTNNATVCVGSTATLTATATNQTGYLWSDNLGTSATVSVSPTATTTYTVTVYDALGCTKTSTATVTVLPRPTITISTPAPCIGKTTTLTTIANGQNALTYTWSISPSPGNISSVSVTPTTNTTYTVTLTDALTQCSASASITAVQCCNLSANFDYCLYSYSNQISLNTVVVSGCAANSTPTYQWLLNGSVISTLKSPPTVALPANLQGTTATICLRVRCTQTNGNICEVEVCRQIFIPVPCLLSASNLAISYTLNNLNTVQATISTFANARYSWTVRNTLTNAIVNTSAVQSPVFSNLAAGTYDLCCVVAIGSAANGTICDRQACRTFVVNPPCATSGRFYACIKPSTRQATFTSNSVGTSPTTTYFWAYSTSATGLFLPLNSVPTGVNTGASTTFIFPAQGTYWVCLILDKGTPCEAKVTYLVTITQGNSQNTLIPLSAARSVMPADPTDSSLDITPELDDSQEPLLFPNPTNGDFTLLLNNKALDAVRVAIFDMKGSLIIEQRTTPTTPTISLHLNQYSAGIYIVQILTQNGEQYSLKVTKE